MRVGDGSSEAYLANFAALSQACGQHRTLQIRLRSLRHSRRTGLSPILLLSFRPSVGTELSPIWLLRLRPSGRTELANFAALAQAFGQNRTLANFAALFQAGGQNPLSGIRAGQNRARANCLGTQCKTNVLTRCCVFLAPHYIKNNIKTSQHSHTCGI